MFVGTEMEKISPMDGDGNLTLGAEFPVDTPTLACQVGLPLIVECCGGKTILESKCSSVVKPFHNPTN
jgi:hypothetical protein